MLDDSRLPYSSSVGLRGVLAACLLVGGAVGCWVDALAHGGLIDAPPALLVVAILGYAVGAWTSTSWALATVTVAAAVLTAANQVAAPGEYHPVDDVFFFLVVVGGPAVAGAAITARRRQVHELTDQTVRLIAQRDAAIRAGRLQEQNRVGVELHRDIAEQFGAVLMRAEGAQRRGSSEELARALADVETTARASLDLLRAALGSLREPPVPSPSPAPAIPRPVAKRPDWRDLALALVCGVAIAAEAVWSDSSRGPAWGNLAAGILVAAPLVWRRTHPLVAATLFMTAAIVMSAVVTPFPVLVTAIPSLLVSSYSVGAYSRRWLIGGLVLIVGVGVVTLVGPAGLRDADGYLPSLALVVVAVAAGLVAAGSIRRVNRLSEGVAELELGRTVATRLAVAEQRNRLAQDLHDTVAHAMTVVCLQAAAGRRLDDVDVLDTIIVTARRGLVELRDGLSALDLDVLDPDGIRAEARRVGLVPSVRVDVGDLAPEVALLASRLVREALINAGRYAPGAALSVRVERELEQATERVTIEVVDEGGDSDFVHGSGTGLTGLAAQVAAAGGRLTWGTSGTGFRVRAVIPLDRTAATP
jgi:signal transduction histidine kinase